MYSTSKENVAMNAPSTRLITISCRVQRSIDFSSNLYRHFVLQNEKTNKMKLTTEIMASTPNMNLPKSEASQDMKSHKNEKKKEFLS